MRKDKVLVPFQIDKDFKNSILEHCRGKGMTLSGLIRMLLKEYAKKEGVMK